MFEAEHEAGPLGRAAIDVGADAERAAIAGKARPMRLQIVETRPPHQRAVAKHPKIAHIAEPDSLSPEPLPVPKGVTRPVP
jgi:hypothetical protein